MYISYRITAHLELNCTTKTPYLLTESVEYVAPIIWFVYVFDSVSGDHFDAGVTFVFAVDGKM
jgi:hypothetical protein